MLKKLLIIPWFGPYPSWLDQWVANMEYLKPMGYDYKIYSNLELFKERAKEILGVKVAVKYRTGKVWDLRPAFGALFPEEIGGYDYWGHTDFDCLYGDIESFISDEELSACDIWSNDIGNVCGPWSLYKNTELVNNAFKLNPSWKMVFESSLVEGWEEGGFSTTADKYLKMCYNHLQTKDQDNFDTLNFDKGKLYEGEQEIMMAHFRRVKQWPRQIQF